MIEKILNRYQMTRNQGLATGLLLALSAFVYLIGLSANGWANAYYAAAAQAGSKSWSAFFYGAFNTTGSITVDKPPLSLWFMDLSVHLFGLNSYAIQLPQALMGIATVLLVFMLIKRYFGFGSGLTAGFALLIVPVAALMFRFNNPDALLTLLMTLAIWATCRLNDRGRLGWAVIIGVFIGLAFMTKTFQAFLIMPALFVAFAFFGRPRVLRRIIAIIITAVSLVVVGGAWFAIVNMIPAATRPYIGSSQSNSVIDLAFGYNGLERLFGRDATSGTYDVATSTPNIFRLFNDVPGGAIGWWLPLTTATFILGAVLFFKTRKQSPQFFVSVLLGLSLLTMVVVFSLMRGIFHAYYTVQLAPVVASLMGVLCYFMNQSRTHPWLRYTLAVFILGSGIYDGFIPILNNDSDNAVIVPIFALAVLGAALFALPPRLTAPYSKFVAFVVIVALAIGPAMYTFFTLTNTQSGSDVRPGPLTHPMSKTDTDSTDTLAKPPSENTQNKNILSGIANLANVPQIAPVTIITLQQNAAAYTYPAAVVGGQNAAAYQLALDKPVLLMGGFNGTDPTPTLTQFKALVQHRKIHYFVLSSGGQNPQNIETKISLWIMANFPGKLVGNAKLYDLTQPTAGAFN